MDGGGQKEALEVYVAYQTSEQMSKIIQWKSTTYNSVEVLELEENSEGFEVNSLITGFADDKNFTVFYKIIISRNWQVISADVTSKVGNIITKSILKTNGNGKWKLNEKNADEFVNCIDIDISQTPFTNSLPINRLDWTENQSQEIKVVYFDILENKIRSAKQSYTKLSSVTYKFENVPNDFEAVIAVDELGFVINYPELFTKI